MELGLPRISEVREAILWFIALIPSFSPNAVIIAARTIPGSTVHGTQIHIAKTCDFWYIEAEEARKGPTGT